MTATYETKPYKGHYIARITGEGGRYGLRGDYRARHLFDCCDTGGESFAHVTTPDETLTLGWEGAPR